MESDKNYVVFLSYMYITKDFILLENRQEEQFGEGPNNFLKLL